MEGISAIIYPINNFIKVTNLSLDIHKQLINTKKQLFVGKKKKLFLKSDQKVLRALNSLTNWEKIAEIFSFFV